MIGLNWLKISYSNLRSNLRSDEKPDEIRWDILMLEEEQKRLNDSE